MSEVPLYPRKSLWIVTFAAIVGKSLCRLFPPHVMDEQPHERRNGSKTEDEVTHDGLILSSYTSMLGDIRLWVGDTSTSSCLV